MLLIPYRKIFCFELAPTPCLPVHFFTPQKLATWQAGFARTATWRRPTEKLAPKPMDAPGHSADSPHLVRPIKAARMAAPPEPGLACGSTRHGTPPLHTVANVITRAALYARCASLPPLRTLAIRSPTRHHCGVERPPPLPLTLPHRLDRCPRRQTYRSERRTTTRFPTRRGCATTRTESACR